jgi:hypothetical protein
MEIKKLLFMALLFLTLIASAQIVPNGIAEDNWGNIIHIDDTIKVKTTLIIPFSTSNCGYCMIDGYFAEKNYIEANIKNGGSSFLQCLFNPQLDIYSFEKHFGSTSPILTYPPALHKIHEDGFPTVLAFKNGKQVVKDYYQYDNYSELCKILWDENQKMTAVGNFHMAGRLFYENGKNDAVMVFPKGKEKNKEAIQMSIKYKSFTCKNIDSLAPEDLDKHLMFTGKYIAKDLSDFFSKKDIPFHFTASNIEFGGYSFNFDSTGVYAWFKSPYNPEKYIIFNFNNGQSHLKPANYLDFLFYTGKDSASSRQLMYGHYKDETGSNIFDSEKTFSDIVLQEYCITQCKLPQKKYFADHANKYTTISTNQTVTDLGKIWTIGNENCRFPDIICAKNNTSYIVYEESGDILLTQIQKDSVLNMIIESDESDSYNPVLAYDGQKIWVFYLNNKDTYYRLYARFIENGNLSDEILLSEKGPFDVITINVASKNDELCVIWCEWKANQRFLKTLKIIQGIMQESKSVALAPSIYTDNYSNAWYPSLCYLSNGELWGSWNQHYPGMLCVIGGNIDKIPQTITHSAEKMDDWEKGGYSCIFSNNDNNKYSVYESDGWQTYYEKKAQQIKICSYNDKIGKWSVASVLSNNKQTFQNQTPVGICDKQGNIIVVWSGRPKNEPSNWGIYLSINISGKWTKPMVVSKPSINSRHPQIAYNKETNSIWISWHAGTGKGMKAEAINISLDKLIY